MFGIGGGEFLVIALITLIAVGPEQLPSVMRKFGSYAAKMRSMADGVRAEFMDGMQELDPVKWTGDGTDEAPIVPRGFAENAQSTTLGPKPRPEPSDEATDPVAEVAVVETDDQSPEAVVETEQATVVETGQAVETDRTADPVAEDVDAEPASGQEDGVART